VAERSTTKWVSLPRSSDKACFQGFSGSAGGNGFCVGAAFSGFPGQYWRVVSFGRLIRLGFSHMSRCRNTADASRTALQGDEAWARVANARSKRPQSALSRQG